MEINITQAEILLAWMAMAATDATDDKEEGESWRIQQFQQQAKVLMEQFNEAAE
jgi:hypothetical protein